ncbi:MAG TPA: Gfo/Idh/MocA family oxidoreductase [Pseudolabrys sp.]|nr:Gfo/Idh/MocA family oxidoreductase [Pseudolabrys sp.]
MTLRIGLIGCGNWGRYILRDLLSLGVAVDVVTRSAETRAQALAQGASIAVEQIDALGTAQAGYVVATPSSTHAGVVTALLATGRPIFVEKPLTTDVGSARRLVAAAPERIFVMDKWRYHSGVEALAAMARSGEFGEILGVRTYRLGWGHPHADADASWILMPHDLSIALEILGFLPAPRSAWSPFPGRAASDMIGVLADADGPKVTMEIATSQPISRRSVVVVGSRRSAQFGDSYDTRLTIVDGTPDGKYGAPYERTIGNDMPLLRELRVFVEHLRGGPPPRSSAAEGALIVERIAALRSMAGLTD